MTADELDKAADEVERHMFTYIVAQVKRDSHKRQAREIENRPIETRTVAELGELAHHKREIREHERAMSESIRAAQAIESRVILATESDT